MILSSTLNFNTSKLHFSFDNIHHVQALLLSSSIYLKYFFFSSSILSNNTSPHFTVFLFSSNIQFVLVK
ncbi:hypothetical protein HOG21_05475 [bacterium]|nr:hypothetical protein [bacterium]